MEERTVHVAVEKISGESLETQISSREIVKTLQIQIANEFRGGTQKQRFWWAEIGEGHVFFCWCVCVLQL